MKSFRLSLGRIDKMVIIRLGQLAYMLKMYRLSMWLYSKIPPFGILLATFVGVELVLTSMLKSAVVETDA